MCQVANHFGSDLSALTRRHFSWRTYGHAPHKYKQTRVGRSLYRWSRDRDHHLFMIIYAHSRRSEQVPSLFSVCEACEQLTGNAGNVARLTHAAVFRGHTAMSLRVLDIKSRLAWLFGTRNRHTCVSMFAEKLQ